MQFSKFSARNCRIFGLMSLALMAAGCAQNSRHFAAAGNKFPSKIYGPASPRVVAEGEEVPKGGGQYLVGKPYTVAGHTYYPSERTNYTATGLASWYGADFHGRKTANGEVFDSASISAAHPTMPLPSYARVTNLRNDRSIIVRVNDRGPYHGGRVMDVSEKVAEALEFKNIGTAKVKVEYVGQASLAGSDDRMLLASLRTDGAPAVLDGIPSQPVMTAEQPAARTQKVASLSTPEDDQGDAADESLPSTFVQPAKVPRPLARPFDLGAVPHAGVPVVTASIPLPRPALMRIAATSTPRAVAKIVRRTPVLDEPQASTAAEKLSALYYTSDAPPIEKFQTNGPFRKLKPRSMEDLLAKVD